MKNKTRDGNTMDYKASAEIKGGSLVIMPAYVGVAVTDAQVDQVISLDTEGVFEFTKDSTALAQGQIAYVKADGTITATAEGNTKCGIVFTEAAGNKAVVAVKINA